MIKLRELEYLDAIDKFKHFGKAAEACHVSQPTLSGQIIKLEKQLGLTLFERHKRNVMLTPAGFQLVEQGRRVLRSAAEFDAMAKALADPKAGDLHLGLIPTLGPYLLPHIMGNLRLTMPRIRFHLHEGQTAHLLEQLDSGKLDMIILAWLDDMDNFNAFELFEEPLLLACPQNHPLNNKLDLNLSDLRDQQVLTLEDGHCLRDQALGYCFSAGAKEDTSFQATSLETLRHMISAGLGITLVPKLAAEPKSVSGLSYLPFTEPQPKRKIVMLTRPNYSRMTCAREMVKAIRHAISELNL